MKRLPVALLLSSFLVLSMASVARATGVQTSTSGLAPSGTTWTQQTSNKAANAEAADESIGTPILTVSSASYDSITASWSAVSGASGYEVWRSTSATGTFALIKTTTGTSYTDTGLTVGQTYYYEVRADSLVGTTKVYGAFSKAVSTVSATSLLPTTAEVDSATRWVTQRKGVIAFAVATSDGQVRGYNLNERFVTASVVKAMLLVAYLRSHPTLSSWAISTLTSMIHISDNSAATAIYNVVGDSGLRSLAKAAGMQNFSVSESWGYAQLTAADQARFFLHMDSYIPVQHRAFARYLLSHIANYESWGIPAVARPAGWTVFFKGGWRGTVRGQLVHQIARLERAGHQPISIAVMTDGDPNMTYGIATISGVTERLLGLAK